MRAHAVSPFDPKRGGGRGGDLEGAESDVESQSRRLVISGACAASLLLVSRVFSTKEIEPVFFSSIDGAASAPRYVIDVDKDGKETRMVELPGASSARARRAASSSSGTSTSASSEGGLKGREMGGVSQRLRVSVDPIGNEVFEDAEGNLYFNLGAGDASLLVVQAGTGEVSSSRYDDAGNIVDSYVGNLSEMTVMKDGDKVRAYFNSEEPGGGGADTKNRKKTRGQMASGAGGARKGDGTGGAGTPASKILEEYRASRLFQSSKRNGGARARKDAGQLMTAAERKQKDKEDVAALFAALSKLSKERPASAGKAKR